MTTFALFVIDFAVPAGESVFHKHVCRQRSSCAENQTFTLSESELPLPCGTRAQFRLAPFPSLVETNKRRTIKIARFLLLCMKITNEWTGGFFAPLRDTVEKLNFIVVMSSSAELATVRETRILFLPQCNI